MKNAILKIDLFLKKCEIENEIFFKCEYLELVDFWIHYWILPQRGSWGSELTADGASDAFDFRGKYF